MKDWPTVAKSHDSRRAKTTAHGILRACLSSCISTTRDEERLIDGQRTGTARPLPRWRLPSGPYSPPIDHIREWYCPQARIAGHLTIQPLGQFQPAPRVSVGPTRIVQECGALATYRPVSRVSISTICRCITGARSDPIEVVPRCPDIIFGKDRPPRHTAVSRRAVSRASSSCARNSRPDAIGCRRSASRATECRSVNFARAVRMMGPGPWVASTRCASHDLRARPRTPRRSPALRQQVRVVQRERILRIFPAKIHWHSG
jgi:hypothetical protein